GESLTNTKIVFDIFKRSGARIITYAKAGGGGLVTYELLRSRPELTIYNDGRPQLENYDAAWLDFMETVGPPRVGDEICCPGSPDEMEARGYKGAAWFKPYTPGKGNWCAVWYDGDNPEVIKLHARELGVSSQTLGLSGVRYDGEFASSRHQLLDGSYNLPEKPDLETSETKMIRSLKEQTWKL